MNNLHAWFQVDQLAETDREESLNRQDVDMHFPVISKTGLLCTICLSGAELARENATRLYWQTTCNEYV
jgi:hypothetical protein